MYFVILISLITFKQSNSAEECIKNATNEYMYHLATKTPYRFVANLVNEKFDFNGCEPQKIWMLVRHGTRYPSSFEIFNMKERLPQIRDLILEKNPEPSDHLRNSDLYALLKWKLKLDATHAKFLAHEGEDEMLELAERMQIRFPELFPSIYSNTTYFFKYTASQRTKSSAQYFVTGLFGRQLVNDVWFPTPTKKDPVLRFYKLCRKWKSDVKGKPETLSERVLFKNSAGLTNIIGELIQELKLDESSLTADDVMLIFKMCAFETAWNRRKTSPWCRVLNPLSLKAMEFLEDLKYYYVDGYGHKLTYQQACPAFTDMLNFFESDSPYPKSTVYFTHSGTILKMLAHLGLYNDNKPLLHTDFIENERQWKVSQIDAFGSNIALILNRCEDKNSLLVLHQERTIRLPGCDSDFCDLETIKKYYKNSINCNFNEMCNNI